MNFFSFTPRALTARRLFSAVLPGHFRQGRCWKDRCGAIKPHPGSQLLLPWLNLAAMCGFENNEKKTTESSWLMKMLTLHYGIVFTAGSLINLNRNVMAENNNRNQSSGQGSEQDPRHDSSSIGNQQATTQTGAQNAGGENIDQEEDQYSEDLRNSGDRNSSNRKTSS